MREREGERLQSILIGLTMDAIDKLLIQQGFYFTIKTHFPERKRNFLLPS